MRDVLQQTVKSRVESAFGKPKLNTKIILKESKSTYILESVENAPPHRILHQTKGICSNKLIPYYVVLN